MTIKPGLWCIVRYRVQSDGSQRSHRTNRSHNCKPQEKRDNTKHNLWKHRVLSGGVMLKMLLFYAGEDSATLSVALLVWRVLRKWLP